MSLSMRDRALRCITSQSSSARAQYTTNVEFIATLPWCCHNAAAIDIEVEHQTQNQIPDIVNSRNWKVRLWIIVFKVKALCACAGYSASESNNGYTGSGVTHCCEKTNAGSFRKGKIYVGLRLAVSRCTSMIHTWFLQRPVLPCLGILRIYIFSSNGCFSVISRNIKEN